MPLVVLSIMEISKCNNFGCNLLDEFPMTEILDRMWKVMNNLLLFLMCFQIHGHKSGQIRPRVNFKICQER